MDKAEVFHSHRSGSIDEMRDEQVESRSRRLQVGDMVEIDEHEGLRCKQLSEKGARILAPRPLNPEIDYSMFHRLDFDAMAKRKRTRGRRSSR